jgi:hypothetical protein
MSEEQLPTVIESGDPAVVLPIEAAREHLQHWWREPVAGAVAVGIATFDSWKMGRDAGLTSSLDEILIVSGIVLIAGTRRLFGAAPTAGNGSGK